MSSLSASDTFAAFRHRNYRLWFIGQLVSLVGTWMQNTAQGFLIYALTGSTAYLGYVGFVSGLPSWLFMLWGGVIADRVSRRAMMIVTQTALMVLALVLAALVFLQVVQPWHILVLSFLSGVANAFDTPARQSFVVELVDRESMTNAIAFNATMFNAGSIIGPAIGGVVYALTGPGWCFTINGISFIAVIIALAVMRLVPVLAPQRRPSAVKAIGEGLRYVRSQPLVQTLSFSVFVMNIFGFGLIALIPAWAVKILHGDVTTNGLLLTSRGVGAVIGGLLIAAYGSRRIRGKMWSVSSFLVPLMIAGFAFSRWTPLSLLLLAGMGLTMITIMNNSNAMVQSCVPDDLRGRVMSLYSLMFMGGGPVGSLLVGVMADRIGETSTAVFCAAMLLLFALLIWFFRPQVRAME